MLNVPLMKHISGGYDLSTGEYDAIATIFNILRVRLRHPGVPDHELMKVWVH